MACAHDLRGLLPAFCRHATDTYENFTRLSDVLITFLKKDPSIHQNVSKALQVTLPQTSGDPCKFFCYILFIFFSCFSF